MLLRPWTREVPYYREFGLVQAYPVLIEYMTEKFYAVYTPMALGRV
jgi:hypothetical protein